MQRTLQLFLFVITVFASEEEYDTLISQDFWRYSKVANCPDETIQNWSCKLCNTIPGVVDSKVFQSDLLDIKSYVAYQPYTDQIILSFRGSVSQINWRLDYTLAYKQYFCPKCFVHVGFLFGWFSVRHDIFLHINYLREKHPNSQLWVTGHSLGGALATLASLDAQLQGYQVSGLYNFGSPRVGNKAFAEFFNQNILTSYRVVHNLDQYPQLPPRFLWYHHVGSEVWLNADSTQYKICNLSGEDPTCQNSIPYKNLNTDDHGKYYNFSIQC